MTHHFVTPPDRERNAFFAGLLERVITAIVDALGEESIESLLMIGAPARGDATITRTADGWESLSDIDIVCLAAPTANTEELERRLAPAVVELNRELGDVCAGVDVGFRTHADLVSPAPAISNYECLRTPIVIWGNEKATEGVRPPDIRSVPPAESLRLVHNRIVETLIAGRLLDRASEDERTATRVLYRVAKLALDGATALLFLRRNVPHTYAERVAAFDVEFGGAKARAALEPFRTDLPAWAIFKSTGDPGALSPLREFAASGTPLGPAARNVWARYAGYAEGVWRVALGATVRADLRATELPLVAAQYRRLEPPARRAGRALRVLRPGAAPPGLFSPWRVLAGAPLASPVNLAYLTAVLGYLRAGEQARREWIDREILRRCPFRLPPGFGSLPPERRLGILVDRLTVFHERILLGRKAATP